MIRFPWFRSKDDEILKKLKKIEERLSVYEYAKAEAVEAAQGLAKEVNKLGMEMQLFDPAGRIDAALGEIKFTIRRVRG